MAACRRRWRLTKSHLHCEFDGLKKYLLEFTGRVCQTRAMTLRILITGFGPFAGFLFNPTQALAAELVRRPHPAFARVTRHSHVFPVSYEAVDRDLPKLIAGEKPDALIMFGLA